MMKRCSDAALLVSPYRYPSVVTQNKASDPPSITFRDADRLRRIDCQSWTTHAPAYAKHFILYGR